MVNEKKIIIIITIIILTKLNKVILSLATILFTMYLISIWHNHNVMMKIYCYYDEHIAQIITYNEKLSPWEI